MEIVHVSVSTFPPILYRFGGAIQRRIWELARLQAKQGHKVVIYSIGEETSVRTEEGVRIYYIRCRSQSALRHLEFQWKVVKHLAGQPECSQRVLHFHSQPEGAWLARHIPGKKLLSYDFFKFRRATSGPLHALYRKLLLQYDVLLPCSEYCLTESRDFWRLQGANMKILYNGVNLQQFYPDPALGSQERHKCGITKPAVLYMGRLCEQKGTDILISAMKRLPGVQLLVVGPIGQFGVSQKGESWSQRIKDVDGLYLGPVEEERVCAIYNACDIFAMPTRVDEMFGMAAVEAQACGKPVVASDHGGLRETVPDSAGRRFQVGNSIDLADKIRAMLDDKALLARCARGAEQNASKYDWKRVVADLGRIYDNALQAHDEPSQLLEPA